MDHRIKGGIKAQVEARTGKSIKNVLLEFQERGYSYIEVAEALKCSVPPIYKYCRQYNIKLPTRDYERIVAEEFTRPPLDFLSKKWCDLK